MPPTIFLFRGGGGPLRANYVLPLQVGPRPSGVVSVPCSPLPHALLNASKVLAPRPYRVSLRSTGTQKIAGGVRRARPR